MTCPDCGQDTLVVSTEYNLIGYEVGDRVECTNKKCFYHKFYEYDPNRVIPNEC